MPHPFDTQLVIADAKYIRLRRSRFVQRLEVVVLIEPAVCRQGQNALLREQVVQFELANLDVEPCRIEDIVEPHVCRFNVEGPEFIRRWNEQETDVLGQGPTRQYVQAGIVKTRRLHICNRAIVQRHMIGGFHMPIRGGSKGNRPVGCLLENGSFAVVPQLVSIVLELLPERAQLRPCFVARRARQAIFSCECGKGTCFCAAEEENAEDHYEVQQTSNRSGHYPANPTTPSIHTASSITLGKTLSRQRVWTAFNWVKGFWNGCLQAMRTVDAPTAPTPTFSRFAPN